MHVDIYFGGDHGVCKNFFEQMQKEFEISMIGELSFLFGL